VPVFSPLKAYYRSIFQHSFENEYSNIYKNNLYLLLLEAQLEAILLDYIRDGFSATSLVLPSLAKSHLLILQESGINSLVGDHHTLNQEKINLLPYLSTLYPKS